MDELIETQREIFLRRLAPQHWMAQTINTFQREVSYHQNGEAKKILKETASRAAPQEQSSPEGR